MQGYLISNMQISTVLQDIIFSNKNRENSHKFLKKEQFEPVYTCKMQSYF